MKRRTIKPPTPFPRPAGTTAGDYSFHKKYGPTKMYTPPNSIPKPEPEMTPDVKPKVQPDILAFSTGTWVRVLKTDKTEHTDGVNEYMAAMAKDSGIARIYDTLGADRVTLTSQHPSCTGRRFNFHIGDLEVIRPDIVGNYALFQKLLDDQMARYQERQKAAIEQVNRNVEAALQPKTEAFEDINYIEVEQKYDYTNMFLQTGITVNDRHFMTYNTYVGNSAVNIMVTEADLGEYMVYLPQQWLSALGVREEQVLDWTDFINSIGFDVQLTYLGLTTFERHRNNPDEGFAEYVAMGQMEVSLMSHENIINANEYYKIKMSGAESGMLNAWVFRLLTGLYHKSLFRVACTALQMRSALGAEHSSIDILMACLWVDYRRWLSMTATANNPTVPLIGRSNTSEEIMARCYSATQAHGVNQMVKTHNVTSTEYKKVVEMLCKKEFASVLSFIKTIQNGTSK